MDNLSRSGIVDEAATSCSDRGMASMIETEIALKCGNDDWIDEMLTLSGSMRHLVGDSGWMNTRSVVVRNTRECTSKSMEVSSSNNGEGGGSSVIDPMYSG
ncbi:OLC1v1029845C1 [Oldenlandia corymbosa var. corymbosa]|uniref:OLC1v1029845C1 n=1 Tax=Oldenlandia corymbosa var. corymbosa TaxID=529605 RepID=A0AAV1CGR1_OLDCO|nr:OLC1v1029845C1 [Oldenlandia corymbosa var. corymbosa]